MTMKNKIELRSAIFIPGAVIFIALFSLLLILPAQIKALLNEWQKIKKIEAEIKDLKTKYLLVSSLDQETLKKQSELVTTALPRDKSVPYILQGVRNAIRGSGFLIKSLKFAPGEVSKEKREKTAKKRIEELPLELKAVGPFDRLAELFDTLEETLPLFQADAIEAVASQRMADNVNVEMELTTFYAPPIAAYQIKNISLDDLVLSEQESALLEKLSQFRRTVIAVKEKEKQESGAGEAGTKTNPFLF